MQATVHRFDPGTGSGSVLTDDGTVLAFDVTALSTSGLRHLRPGQRLSVDLAGDGQIAGLRLGTIGSTYRPAPAGSADPRAVGDPAGTGIHGSSGTPVSTGTPGSSGTPGRAGEVGDGRVQPRS